MLKPTTTSREQKLLKKAVKELEELIDPHQRLLNEILEEARKGK